MCLASPGLFGQKEAPGWKKQHQEKSQLPSQDAATSGHINTLCPGSAPSLSVTVYRITQELEHRRDSWMPSSPLHTPVKAAKSCGAAIQTAREKPSSSGRLPRQQAGSSHCTGTSCPHRRPRTWEVVVKLLLMLRGVLAWDVSQALHTSLGLVSLPYGHKLFKYTACSLKDVRNGFLCVCAFLLSPLSLSTSRTAVQVSPKWHDLSFEYNQQCRCRYGCVPPPRKTYGYQASKLN